MPFTSLPQGIGITPSLGAGSIYDLPPSNIWFVCNRAGVTSGDGRGRDRPLASFADAIANISTSVPNNSEWIVALAGHVENVTGNNTFSGSAVNTGAMVVPRGTRIIGEGSGSSVPALTFTATGSLLAMAAADCSIENVQLSCSAAAVTTAVGIAVTAANCAVIKCQWKLTSTAGGLFTNPLTISSAANFFTADFNYGYYEGAATPVGWLNTVGTAAAVGVRARGNTVSAILSTTTGGIIDWSTTTVTPPLGWDISYNRLANFATNSTVAMRGVAAGRGWAYYNGLGIANATGGATAFNTPGSFHCNQNMGTAQGANALLTPAVSG